MQYQLNINIGNDDVQRINQFGQYVTIAKVVNSGSNHPVAWLTFSPLEENNVSWEVAYSLFASLDTLQNGAKIHQSSSTPAKDTYTYAFQNGVFTQGAKDQGNGIFAIMNEQVDMTFGIAQAAVVNNVAINPTPIAVMPTLLDELVTFEPSETVLIFLSHYTDNGIVLSSVTSDALKVRIDSTNPTAIVSFDGKRFVTGS